MCVCGIGFSDLYDVGSVCEAFPAIKLQMALMTNFLLSFVKAVKPEAFRNGLARTAR